MRIIATTVLLWVSFLSSGQNDKTNYKSTSSAFNNISQQESTKINESTDISTPNNKKDNADKKISSKKEKEWKKIKRQIRRNRKRISKHKNSIYTSRIIDTIYVDIPSNKM